MRPRRLPKVMLHRWLLVSRAELNCCCDGADAGRLSEPNKERIRCKPERLHGPHDEPPEALVELCCGG